MPERITVIGGGRRLGPILAAAFVLTVSDGSFGLLIPPYLAEVGLSSALIGGLVAVYGLGSVTSRAFAGGAYRSNRAARLAAGATLVSAAVFVTIPTRSDAVGLALLIGLHGSAFAFGSTVFMAAVMERKLAAMSSAQLMGLYTGSLGLGYAVSGFLAGPVGDEIGVGGTFRLAAVAAVVAAMALLGSLSGGDRGTAIPRVPDARTRHLGQMPRAVWQGFSVATFINLVSGVLMTFYPIYALELGLTLGHVGLVFGLHGIAASLVRFASVPLFASFQYRRSVYPAVLLTGAAMLLIGLSRSLSLAIVAWVVVGLARGVLRVASAALVTDSTAASGGRPGAAAGVYLSGLDVGKVLGPAMGGLMVSSLGIPATLAAAGLGFTGLFLSVYAGLGRPANHPPVHDPGDGTV